MKRSGVVMRWFFVAGLLGGVARAAEKPLTLDVDVWPGNPLGQAQPAEQEQWQKKRVTHVTHPTLTVFRPAKDKDTGVAILVCPGGGYTALMTDYEGEDIARWLNTIGITGIVLKYRVPAPPDVPRYLPALQDAQRAMSLVRSKAAEWKIDPNRIGMLGFSAGGHLTAATSTNCDKWAYEPIDAIDQVSDCPNFAVVIYPGGVVRKETDELSPESRVTKQTPPMFIAQANDDPVNADNSVFLYLALKRAGVPAELHIYAKGGHGFGMKENKGPAATWPLRMDDWLHSLGVLK